MLDIPIVLSGLVVRENSISDIEKQVLDEHMAQAYVIINCKKGQEENVLQNMSKIPEVIENDMTIGSYGIISKISSS